MNSTVFAIACIGVGTLGCTEVPTVSETCEAMCEEATSLFSSCLEGWRLEWSSAGFENAAAHQESCEVWSWQNSEIHGSEKIDALCEERGKLLEDGECSDYSDIDWNDVP